MAQFWYSSARGRRPSMEDIHITAECPVSKWILFAVCDGHGGTHVVKFLEKVLSARILKALARASQEDAAAAASGLTYQSPVRASYLRQCLKLAVISLDAEIEREIKTIEGRGSGSTLVMMAYQPLTRQIVLVNVGDSRAVLSFPNSQSTTLMSPGAGSFPLTTAAVGGMGFLRRGGQRRLIETKDHKPTDKDEMLRVIGAGSFVSKSKRVGGILALSRAMGDFSLKTSLRSKYDPVNGAVCAMPDVQVGYINPTSFATAVLACDGIWDVMSSQEAAETAEQALAANENPAEKLVHVAFQKQSSDNLTCLVIRLHPRLIPPPPTPK